MEVNVTADQVRKLLKQKQGKGTQKALADRIGVTPAYLSDIYAGNRQPSGKVLAFLKLKRDTVYS